MSSGMHGMCGDDKQGQLSGAVELPKLVRVWYGEVPYGQAVSTHGTK